MTVTQLDAAPRAAGVEHVFTVPCAPEAVSVVRRGVRAALVAWNLPTGVADDVLLVVSELVTNALVHAAPPATLRLSRVRAAACGAVRVEVADTGPTLPGRRAAPPPDPDEHGRGLDIVATLSARHGTRVHCGGVSRWADVPEE
ncbi:ATP-binding protein [Streptomyces sp. NPDC007264]|uniref:ATP-binding protein n=1 Tax=Streptomyces sp. NPDC007264 TaxID=3364777 RepID=UPI0036D9433C